MIFGLYIPALMYLGLGVYGMRDLLILRRRGVKTEGSCGGMSWNANIASIDVWYRDENRDKHYITMAPEDLRLTRDESVVRVIYDPLRPARATTEKVLSKSIWKAQEGYMTLVGIGIAVLITVVLVLAFNGLV